MSSFIGTDISSREENQDYENLNGNMQNQQDVNENVQRQALNNQNNFSDVFSVNSQQYSRSIDEIVQRESNNRTSDTDKLNGLKK